MSVPNVPQEFKDFVAQYVREALSAAQTAAADLHATGSTKSEFQVLDEALKAVEQRFGAFIKEIEKAVEKPPTPAPAPVTMGPSAA